MPERRWPDLAAPPANVFPELLCVYGLLRGQHQDYAKAAYAGAVVLSFGLAQLPEGSDAPAAAARAPAGPEDAADRLERLVPALADPKPTKAKGARALKAAGAVPWGEIIAVVGPLLLEWFRRRRQ